MREMKKQVFGMRSVQPMPVRIRIATTSGISWNSGTGHNYNGISRKATGGGHLEEATGRSHEGFSVEVRLPHEKLLRLVLRSAGTEALGCCKGIGRGRMLHNRQRLVQSAKTTLILGGRGPGTEARG